jgi:hypothetical protein
MPHPTPAAIALALALALPTAQAAPAACPQATEQLAEYLAGAKQRVRADGEVRVEFEVGADGRAQALAVQGSRAYLNPVRIAMDSLECQRGTPQRYVLNIRFAEPAPRAMASAASASLAEVSTTDKVAPR